MSHKLTADEIHNIKKGLHKEIAKFSKPPPPPTDIDRLVQRTEDILNAALAHAKEIDAAVRAAGTEHNRTMLREEFDRFFLDRLCHYSKDELLLVLVMSLTKAVIAKLI